LDCSIKYEPVLEIVIAKSKRIRDDIYPDETLIAVKEAEQVIKNYCSIPEVPAPLLFTWANIATDLIMYKHESDNSPEDILSAFDPSDVSNIKLGDTSISLGDKYRNNQRSRILQSHQANLDSLIMNYQAQLNQFRRLF
jgi:hypothetical protein